MKVIMTGHPNIGWLESLRTKWNIDFVDINDGELSKLKQADLIFHYIIQEPIKKVIPETEVIAEIKKEYPDKKVMIFFDWELSKNPDCEWRSTFRNADLILHCGPLDRLGEWQDYAEKCLFLPIPTTMDNAYKYQPFEPHDFAKETRWVAIMQHTHPLSDIAPALMNLGEIGAPIKFFSGMYHVNVKRSEYIVRSWGITKYKIYPRLQPEEYFKELSECYIAHDNCGAYVGWSRFVYECAAYNIPVVSGLNVSANRVANSLLCNDDPARQVAILKKLMNDWEFRNFHGFKANERLKYYCSVDRVVSELNKRLKTLGLNP